MHRLHNYWLLYITAFVTSDHEQQLDDMYVSRTSRERQRVAHQRAHEKEAGRAKSGRPAAEYVLRLKGRSLSFFLVSFQGLGIGVAPKVPLTLLRPDVRVAQCDARRRRGTLT